MVSFKPRLDPLRYNESIYWLLLCEAVTFAAFVELSKEEADQYAFKWPLLKKYPVLNIPDGELESFNNSGDSITVSAIWENALVSDCIFPCTFILYTSPEKVLIFLIVKST